LQKKATKLHVLRRCRGNYSKHCGFIESAKEESIETILEMALNKETGSCKALIVTGCMAQRYSKDMKKEILKWTFIGTGEFHRISEVLHELKENETIELVSDPEYVWRSDMPRLVSTPFYYAYLKIGEGCSHKMQFLYYTSVKRVLQKQTCQGYSGRSPQSCRSGR
jgi:tRNA A37 methylthiotransferase MiaB